MQPSKALLIDDEEYARLHLREILAVTDPDVKIVGEAAEFKTAQELIARGGYDFLFLDVKLGPRTGFDLVPEVPADKPIIFVSGYEHHARRAFEVNAVDYLMKPVEPARLTQSLNRLRERHRPPATAITPPPAPAAVVPLPESFAIEINGRARLVAPAEIAYIEAQQNYSSLHLRDGANGLVRRSLKSWEEALPPADFARVHRNAVVNLNHILGYHHETARTIALRVAGVRAPVSVSRHATVELKSLLRARFPY